MAKSFSDLPGPVQVLVLASVAVVAAGAVFYFGIPGVIPSTWGLREKIDRLDKEVKKLHAENQVNEAYRQEQVRYQNEIAQLKRQLETVSSILPEERATDGFIRTVFAAGKGSSINIRTFIAQPEVSKDLYSEMPFSIRIDGTYNAMMGFFYKLANEQRLVSVSIAALSMGAPAGGGRGAYTVSPVETVGANCLLTTYYSHPEAPAPVKKK